jgi:hypothetical protein
VSNLCWRELSPNLRAVIGVDGAREEQMVLQTPLMQRDLMGKALFPEAALL